MKNNKKCKMCSNDIPNHRVYCSNRCKFSDHSYTKRLSNNIKNDPTIHIKCNHCDFSSSDENNLSGILTTHLKEHNISTSTPLDHFTKFSIEPKETISCPLCDWTTTDLKNKSGVFTVHLKKKHNLESFTQFTKDNPQLKDLFSKQVDLEYPLLNKDKRGVQCKECGEWFRSITNQHLKYKHNLTPTEYKQKWLVNTTSLESHIKRSNFTSNLNKSLDNLAIHSPKGINTRVLNNFIKYKERIEEDFKINVNFEDYKNHNNIKFKCKACGNEFETDDRYPRCYICFPKFYSKEEEELSNFIESLGFDIEKNNRKILNGKEIDILIPSKRIGIEYNGLYWHTDTLHEDKNYHINKTLLANKSNIRLIQIFSDEWNNKREIVKNRIKHILGLYDKKIFARKCIIKEISPKIKKEFLNNYHIQGDVRSKINIGAYYNDDLVAVMTFGNLRLALGNKGKNKDDFELLRFVSKSNWMIIGIANKLFSYFKRNYNYNKIISYSDLRWGTLTNSVYEKLGFKLQNITKPNYWYTDNKNRFYRFQFRKSELVKEGYDPSLSEKQIMIHKGYSRVWDCGHLKYELKVK